MGIRSGHGVVDETIVGRIGIMILWECRDDGRVPTA